MNPLQLVSWAETSISPFPEGAPAPGRYCLPAPAARLEAKIPRATCAPISSIFSKSREGVTPLYLFFSVRMVGQQFVVDGAVVTYMENYILRST